MVGCCVEVLLFTSFAPHPEGWVAQTKMNPNGKVSVHVYLGPMDDSFASPLETPNGISVPD